jgi:hypothetical protein
MPLLIHNIVSLFKIDTLIASTNGVPLKEYMMTKHGWKSETYGEYLHIYMHSLTKEKSEPLMFSGTAKEYIEARPVLEALVESRDH